MFHLRAMLPVLLALGVGGLVPFVALSLAVLSGLPTLPLVNVTPRAALLTYGAVIASFLGGIRWGSALREAGHPAGRDFALSIVPSLVAWACLALPGSLDLAGLGLLILIWGAVDQDLPRRGLAPPWFGRLRLLLSGVAGLALLAAATR